MTKLLLKYFPQRIKQIKEEQRCESNIKICSNVFQFGECRRHGCQLRHIFNKSDASLLQLPQLTNIKFELISINSPSSYVVKVQSYFVDGQWISLKAQNSEIERLLNKDLQTYCSSIEASKVPAVFKVGEIFAVQYNKQWNRCKVVDNK